MDPENLPTVKLTEEDENILQSLSYAPLSESASKWIRSMPEAFRECSNVETLRALLDLAEAGLSCLYTLDVSEGDENLALSDLLKLQRVAQNLAGLQRRKIDMLLQKNTRENALVRDCLDKIV